MNRAEIERLLEIKEYPCVSILLPTHRKYPGSTEDRARLEKLVRVTRERLKQEFAERDVAELLHRLDRLVEEVDYRYLLDGLALFASRNHSRLYALPFPVRERVHIGDSYAVRELAAWLSRSIRYWVLVLTEPRLRLLWGCDGRLSEVSLESFPIEHFVQEAPEQRVVSSAIVAGGTWYPGAHRGPSGIAPLPGDYAPDLSRYRDEHLKQFFREGDKMLDVAFAQDAAPLIVAGVDRNIALFKTVSAHAERIAGTVSGSFDKTWDRVLPAECWNAAQDANRKREAEAVETLEKAVSHNRYSCGIQEVWQVARAGRCQFLLVERDYFCPARIEENGQQIEPAENAGAPGVIEDAVNEITEYVLASGGEVVFVESGKLTAYGRIAAVLRF